MRVLAVDPGSRYVAIVARDTTLPPNDPDGLLEAELVDRKADPDLDRIEAWVSWAVTRSVIVWAPNRIDAAVVEAAQPPRGHANGRPGHLIAPGPLIETAMVAGAIVAVLEAHVIPPAGYGNLVPQGATRKMGRRILEASYPPDLIGPRETTGAGKGPRQHLRAAWDLAAASVPHVRHARGDHP